MLQVTSEKMIEYLEKVLEIETSLYLQNRIADKIQVHIGSNKWWIDIYAKDVKKWKGVQGYERRVKAWEELGQRYKSEIPTLEIKLSEVKAVQDKTRGVLDEMYVVNIIFPKYRNIVAISSFLEYFMTGRVDALSGPNGAYNLYESELRMGLIIDKLDKIIDKLDTISSNQYLLYQEVKKTNSAMEKVQLELDNIGRINASIAESAAITAVCSEATAKNTEALKYIALVK